MWEQHGMSAAAALTGIMMGSGIPKQDYAPTLKQKVFARFFDHIGMGGHSDIINVIVTKVRFFCEFVYLDERKMSSTCVETRVHVAYAMYVGDVEYARRNGTY